MVTHLTNWAVSVGCVDRLGVEANSMYLALHWNSMVHWERSGGKIIDLTQHHCVALQMVDVMEHWALWVQWAKPPHSARMMRMSDKLC